MNVSESIGATLSRIEQGEFFLIAGPCVIESEEICAEVAETVGELAAKLDVPYVFKSSFQKANRLSKGSFCGPGIESGLRTLRNIKERFSVPILTDVHETCQIEVTSEVAEILQIPAFLCRQTELVTEAARTGKWVNIKKGQFLAPEDMSKIAAKAGSTRVMLTERGTTFGYHNLVIDFRSLLIMKQSTGLPIVFDATHSLQLPSGGGDVSTGQPEFVIPMSRAAAAVGISGLFVETHSNPSAALSDAGVMLPLDDMTLLLDAVLPIVRGEAG